MSSSRLISMHEASPDLVKSGLGPHHLNDYPQKNSDSSRQHPPPEKKKGALVSWQGIHIYIYISINLTKPPKSWTMETANDGCTKARNGFIQVKQPVQLVRSLGVRSVIKQNILRLVPSCVGPVCVGPVPCSNKLMNDATSTPPPKKKLPSLLVDLKLLAMILTYKTLNDI